MCVFFLGQMSTLADRGSLPYVLSRNYDYRNIDVRVVIAYV